jgi:hypothetical protein
MTRRMKFTKQYKPRGFGDLPDGRTVEGRRLAAQRAAETRRFNKMVKEREEAEKAANWWPLRMARFIGGVLQHGAAGTVVRILRCVELEREKVSLLQWGRRSG